MRPARVANMVVAGIAGFAATISQSAEYRWLNSWDRNLPQVALFAEPYARAIEAASKGSIKLNVSGPESVPSFEQLQPTASGAFHFLYTHGAYHFGTSPLLATAEAVGGTPAERKASGVFEAIDRQYQKIGLKLLAMPMTPDGGYQIILKRPPTANGDLQGHKIRGNPTYAAVIKLLGASMVTLPMGEIYTSVDKGVIDGFAFPTFGALESRYYEPAKYLLRASFGFSASAVLANLATWNKFSSAEKKIILDEGVKHEDKWLRESAQLIQDEEKTLIAKGMQVVQMGEAQRAKLKRAWSDGLWDNAAQKFKKETEEIRAIARGKGLD